MSRSFDGSILSIVGNVVGEFGEPLPIVGQIGHFAERRERGQQQIGPSFRRTTQLIQFGRFVGGQSIAASQQIQHAVPRFEMRDQHAAGKRLRLAASAPAIEGCPKAGEHSGENLARQDFAAERQRGPPRRCWSRCFYDQAIAKTFQPPRPALAAGISTPPNTAPIRPSKRPAARSATPALRRKWRRRARQVRWRAWGKGEGVGCGDRERRTMTTGVSAVRNSSPYSLTVPPLPTRRRRESPRGRGLSLPAASMRRRGVTHSRCRGGHPKLAGARAGDCNRLAHRRIRAVWSR